MNTLELNEEIVGLGSTVTICDLESGEVDVYTLAPPGQADIAANRISIATPIAHAIYGRRAGDVVEVEAPVGTIRLRIDDVRTQAAPVEYG